MKKLSNKLLIFLVLAFYLYVIFIIVMVNTTLKESLSDSEVVKPKQEQVSYFKPGFVSRCGVFPSKV